MQYTDTEGRLLINQLRKARDEVARAKLMMKAVASYEADNATVEDLDEMVQALTNHIDSIVKADLIEDEDDESEK
jgi:hypothetical protein